MYQLLVYYPGDKSPRATLTPKGAADVLTLIQQALADHSGCERVAVMLDSTLLFAVDCAGNRLP